MDSITNSPKTPTTTHLLAYVLISVLTIAVLISTAGQALATGAIFYALETGEVRALDMETGGDTGISIPDASFFGDPPPTATRRNIAYDPDEDLLWYSADDSNVHSLYVSTLAAGPIISDIGDAPLGAIRTIAIDSFVRRLYISSSLGHVEVYNLQTNAKMFTIPLSAFGSTEPNPGNRRRLAADGNGNLWYAANDGDFKEFVPRQDSPSFTGRVIQFVAQNEPLNPRQYRAFVTAGWPNHDHHLYYATSEGDVLSFNLDTLAFAGLTLSEPWFWTTSNPGALRTLAIDPTWTPSGAPPAMPTGIIASDGTYPDMVEVSWNPVPNTDDYLVYRRTVGTGTWGSIAVPLMTPPLYDYQSIVPGEVYEYAVRARNQWGLSEQSTDTDTGYAAGMAPPTGLSASQGTFDDRVRVSWDGVSGATGYLVGRVLYGGGMPTTVWVTTTTWDDMNALPLGSTWEYWVYACTDPSTCSASSDPAWGWISSLIFADGFESGDLLGWSDSQY